ncbi:restriction endonuclease [Campylobacter sp. MIT 21-1685]|uniref:restriction endonuclease n=1 Tax=unclassified Campylobacter TaxID=2593542 RepID=UPI00224B834E|nr:MULTISPECIES: restriction endonuclease [unclassified Campylobacter]MCX2683449.1 restriction endonuclease [Campylobacter sp. MIT 21-1684]MCX2751729.1 restriction endonuclease [Campylobacter sp. MIT 21-1682]MCX2807931.1 restriction endonuclease [Campylobacter sp. MIT 21-1685]
MATNFPQKLYEIVEFLQQQNLTLSINSRDGRVNSAFNEDEIFNLLCRNFVINRQNMRDWFDFSFEENGDFYPVNIKITKLSTDNLNCKLGIYYAFTGKIPHFDNEISWLKFFQAIRANAEQNSRDYYFLVINKNDTRDIFATSLKSLNVLTPNGNNLPFQANWAKNKILQNRNFTEAKDFILGAMAKSFALRARIYNKFLEYFPEFRINNDKA